METNNSAFEKDDWVQALPGFAYYYLADLHTKKYEDFEEAMVIRIRIKSERMDK